MAGKLILTACFAAALLLTVYGGGLEKSNSFPETRNVSIFRKIGHELLLTSGDSTTRVLPLKKLSESEYQLFFETKQRIIPDSFVRIVHALARHYSLPDNFTASIHQCRNHELVYSTLFSRNPKEEISSCLGRTLPKDCYYLKFVFATSKSRTSRVWLWSAAALMVLSSAVYFLYYRKKQNKQNSSHTIISSPAEQTIQLGQTVFYPGQQFLIFNEIKTALTPRESKLLGLLAASPNLLIDRDILQREIWEKEGVIVTRSLDMFVSKLRKKLQPDPSLKISVVHGKGYKLEIS